MCRQRWDQPGRSRRAALAAHSGLNSLFLVGLYQFPGLSRELSFSFKVMFVAIYPTLPGVFLVGEL